MPKGDSRHVLLLCSSLTLLLQVIKTLRCVSAGRISAGRDQLAQVIVAGAWSGREGYRQKYLVYEPQKVYHFDSRCGW